MEQEERSLASADRRPTDAGEALVAVLEELGAIRVLLKEILEAVYGIQIGDDVLWQAVNRYNRKMNIARGGPL